MNQLKITYWQDGKWWLGYICDYPEYETQGKTLDELKQNLLDIYNDINDGKIDGIRKTEFIEVV